MDCHATSLFCVFGSPAFADDIDLDLSGILQFLFDLLGDISCHEDHALVGNLFGFDHDAHLTARLDRIGFVNAGEAAGNFFQLLQTLDEVFNVFSARARSCCRDGVCRLHNECDYGLRLNVTVVSLDRVYYFSRLFVLSCNVYANKKL